MTYACARLASCALLLVLACGPDLAESDTSSTGTPGPSTTSTSDSASSSDGSASAPTSDSNGATSSSTSDSDATASTSTSDATASSSTSDATASTSEPSTVTGDPPGPALPAGCESTDPEVAAGFAIALPGWPPDHTLPPLEFVTCVIDEVIVDVIVDFDVVTTKLTCDIAGTLRPVEVTIDAGPEGPVAWGAGQSVRLRHADIEGDSIRRSLHMKPIDDDDAVLILALDMLNGDGLDVLGSPLQIDVELACDPEMTGESRPTLLRFGLPDDSDALELFNGHRGVLAIDDAFAYAIDLAESRGNALHPDGRVQFLIRRVAD